MAELTRVTVRPTGAGEMFQLLRDGRPRTRADLAQVTGQARSTIAARIDLLLASGLVGPSGEATSTGGRPPTTFAFRPDARLVLAVDLGATHARLAVTDLASTVLAEHHEAISIADGPDVVLDRAAGLLDLRYPVPALPFGLQLTGVRPAADGVHVTVEATDTVLRG